MIASRAEPHRESWTRGPVAVVVSRFPKITETFILREIAEMERQGQAVRLVTLIRESPTVVHPEANRWLGRLLHVPYRSIGFLAANLRRWLFDPRCCLVLLSRLVAGTWRRPSVAIRSLVVFPQAVAIAERLEQEGVEHIHAQFATYPATVAWLISRLTGIGFSFTVHAHDLFVHQLLLREKIEAARFVRTISEFNRAQLIQLAPRAAERIHVIRVGVDTGAAALPPDEGDGSPPLLLAVAALEEYKGLDVLIAACAKLHEAGVRLRCRIIGRGRLEGRLRAQIRTAGLGDRVELMGARPEEEVARWMRSAAVVVQPSVVARDGQMEGIPVALMEALRARRPVVASHLSGIPELITDGVHGLLVPPGDPDSLAAALRRVLEDPPAAERMAGAGSERVREAFDLARNTSRLIAQFDHQLVPSPESTLLGEAGFHGRSSTRTEDLRADSRIRRLLVATETGTRELILKRHLSRPGESAPPEARALKELSAVESIRESGPPILRVPRILASAPERGELLFEACEGSPLDSRIRESRRRMPESLLSDLRAVGAWLAAYHAQSRGSDGAAFRLAEILDEIERRFLPRARLSIPEAERCLARCGRLVEALAGTEPRRVTIHGDFWPGNIFVGPSGVEVIDFEGARPGLAEEDVANFLVELRLFHLRPGLSGSYSAGAREFLRGVGGALAAGVELCAVHAALRSLCTASPRGVAGWKARWRRRILLRTAVGGGILP